MNFKRSYIKDMGINTIAFGLYIAIQQLVIMPKLAKITTDSMFSNIILFITIFNILSVVIGDELGNTRLIRYKFYKENSLSGDFDFIYLIIIGIIIIISVPINFLLKIEWIKFVVCLIIIILGITRYFSMSYYKLKQNFKKILITNIFYGMGALIGLYFATAHKFYLAPFLIGEIFSVIFVLYMICSNEDQQVDLSITPEIHTTLLIFGQLVIVAIIINSIAYLDRIIIYPVLGATAMVIYYSASSMSKMISLIINPISGVLLAKMTLMDKTSKWEVVAVIMKSVIPFFSISFLISWMMSYIGVNFFYSQYIAQAVLLLVPISLATSLSLISFLLKPVVMTFFKTKDLLIINIIYGLVFCSSLYFFSIWWGITGFAWAGCLGRFAQFISYMLIIMQSRLEKAGTY